MSELEVLVELQELDTRLSQLTHRSKTLPEYEQLATLQAEDSELKNSFGEIEVELSTLRQSQNDREAEIQQLLSVQRRYDIAQRSSGAPRRN